MTLEKLKIHHPCNPTYNQNSEKLRELENNLTIFETCVLDHFHGQKIKENCFLTGRREDRS